jgi:hypothetical protein
MEIVENYPFCKKCKGYIEHKVVSNFSANYKEKVKINSNNFDLETVEFDTLASGTGYERITIRSNQTAELFEDFFYEWTYEIMQCCSCSSVKFRSHEYLNNEIRLIEWHPAHQDWHIAANAEIVKLVSDRINTLYAEVVSTYNNSNYLSASAMIRTMIEQICNEKLGKNNKTLNKMIDELAIPPKYVDALHNIRKIGNAAVHEAYNHDKDLLLLVIKALEMLVLKIYEPEKLLQEEKKLNIINNRLDHINSNRK